MWKNHSPNRRISWPLPRPSPKSKKKPHCLFGDFKVLWTLYLGQTNQNIPNRGGVRSALSCINLTDYEVLTPNGKCYGLNMPFLLYRLWPETRHSKLTDFNISLHWKYRAVFFRFLIIDSLSRGDYLHYYPFTWSKKYNFESLSCMALWIDPKSKNKSTKTHVALSQSPCEMSNRVAAEKPGEKILIWWIECDKHILDKLGLKVISKDEHVAAVLEKGVRYLTVWAVKMMINLLTAHV